ncbi:MAG: hypothetical protein HYU69_02720 [Bacteroidetes bacterium]|nr:hypothetical protein [Bacteroidota bacterium]
MSKHLFSLIKSLSMSEKRHFKLFSSKHVKSEKNNYVRLFDAIEKQDEYDESQLIRSEKYISNLSVLKARLYNAILNSLRSYNANASVKNKLKAEIDHIEILRNKGLTDQAKKILQQAKKKAEKFEFWEIWLELFNWEINLIKAENYVNIGLSDLEDHFSEYSRVLNKQLEIKKNLLFESVAFSTFRKLNQTKNADDDKRFRNIIKRFYIADVNGLSFSALLHNYLAKSVYHTAMHNYSEALTTNEKLLKLMEQQPDYIQNNPKEYAKSIYNYALSIVLLDRYSSSIFGYLDKLKQISFKAEADRKQYLIMAYFLELSIYCHIGEFEKGLLLINKARKSDLIHLENKNEFLEIINVSLNYFVAFTYFGMRDYKQCNKYLSSIINYNSPIGTGYTKASKLFRIIVDFETGSSDMLEYSLKSAYRHLYKQRDTASKAEVLLLKFLKQQFKNQFNGKQLIKSMSELKSAFEKLRNNKFERSFISDFDYISWLESKIEGRPFADVVKERVKVVIGNQ